ncbi:helix-turn-helix transcriptional regulator [Pedobacter sp. SYSU D00535]|uniref:helix-turn-helix transcriptional regulator n=1 Tax=Pedobacter sp. SYSU D00535 TaxID=2810308 RepID=UPI001A97C563|nr:helix-turn-helix transcriptional regulator [Pedobacter sp. SYSU D00535]
MDTTYRLSAELIEKIDRFAPEAERMPGVVIIHKVGDFPVVYMSSNGLKMLGVTLNELQEMGTEYYSRFFNIEDMSDFIPKMNHMLQSRDPEATFTFFQQVKFHDRKEWVWHVASTRIFTFDSQGNPELTVTVAVPIDQMKHIAAKAERLLRENLFLKENYQRFSTLGEREKEVLALVAQGKSSKEIACDLHISTETINTHRRNIKRKLNITTNFDFTEYARAFDLI